jgi:ribose transport system permease protein
MADNQTVNYDGSPINGWMTTADPFSRALPAGVWVALGLAILTAVVLRNTVFGRHIFALGSNEATARLCGIATTRLKIAIYTLAGAFFGLAGLFQLSRLRQGDPTVAVGLELDIIASVIIGGASLNGGVGTILGSMIGALIMAVLRNGSQQMGWPTYFQEIIIGLVIIVAVFLDRLRQGKQA